MEADSNCGEEPRQVIYVPAFSDFPQRDESDEVDLRWFWEKIWQAKWFIACFAVACTLIAALISFFVLPVTYKSEAVLMPIESMNSDLSKLASSFPIPFNLPGGEEKSNSLLAFLKSRNLKERLIAKYELLPRLYKSLWNPVKKVWMVDDPKEIPTVISAIQSEALEDIYQVDQDKETNLISLSWTDEDPAFAAKMLEYIIFELQYFLDNEYETDAMREREFVEGQLAEATKDLEYWEQQVPSSNLNLATIQRELLAAQSVYTELRKQLELSKISEAKDLIRFKVLDKPYVPVEKYKPKRGVICVLTLVGSGMLAIFLVFGYQSAQKAKDEKLIRNEK